MTLDGIAKAATACAVMAFAACAHGDPQALYPPRAPRPPVPVGAAETPDDAFRQAPPAPGPSRTYEAPIVQEARLPNGLRVLLFEKHQFPLVSFRIVVARGAGEAASGVATIVANLLAANGRTQSTDLRTVQLRNNGARFDARASLDSIELSMEVPRITLRPTLLIAADMIRLLSVSDFDLAQVRRQHVAALAERRISPSGSLSQLVAELVFPSGPFRYTPGVNDDPSHVTREDVERFLREEMAPDDTTLVVAGDTTLADLMPIVTEALGAWSGRAKPLIPAPPTNPVAAPTAPTEHHVVVLNHENDSQSNIRVACAALQAGSHDTVAFDAANAILSTRLSLSLRGLGHYTYGASSSHERWRGGGLFQIRTAVEREHTGDALRAIAKEVQRIRTELPTDAELAAVREQLVYHVLARFETVGGSTAVLANMARHDLPLNANRTRIEAIRKLTREDVQQAAQARLVESEMQTAIVGDATAILPQLTSLDLGTPEVRALPAGMHADAPPEDVQ